MADFFPYRAGELYAEAVPVARIAEAVGTPFYVYSAGSLAARYCGFAEAFAPERALICYAVKANSNLAVLRIFARLGAGADVVSEGELRRALAAGIPPQRIIFSGVGKTRAELQAALDAGIHQINVEFVAELRRLSEVATARGETAPIAIRVNPDVDALTHAKIATGKKENKFGIDLEDAGAAYRIASELPGIAPVGLAMHIGSQIVELAPFRRAFARLAELVLELRSSGLAVRRLDLGGGLGIRYHGERPPEPKRLRGAGARCIRRARSRSRLRTRPGAVRGRRIAGRPGDLCQGGQAARRFVIVDAAMNDLIRPALYEAWHDIVPVRLPVPGAVLSPADVVGPVCETGDSFATDRDLPPLAEDDLVALTDAGAYGAVMSSTYNSRLLVPEVLVAGGRFAVIRKRPSYDQLLGLDTVPDWLSDPLEEPAGKRGAA